MTVGDVRVLDGCLVHGFLTDGDGAVFETAIIGKYPRIPRGWLLDVAIDYVFMFFLLCVTKDAGGSTS